MVDRVPVVDAEKFAPSPDNFDKGSIWRILEPLVAVLEPKCEDSSLVDPSTSKYSEGKQLSTENKVIKMNYMNISSKEQNSRLMLYNHQNHCAM